MFVNLTKHAIVLQGVAGSRATIPPSGTVARIETVPGERIVVHGDEGLVEGIPLHEAPKFGEPLGLPPHDPTSPNLYLVSSMFIGRVGSRPDVFAPGTGPNDGAVYNEKGLVEAVTRLIRC